MVGWIHGCASCGYSGQTLSIMVLLTPASLPAPRSRPWGVGRKLERSKYLPNARIRHAAKCSATLSRVTSATAQLHHHGELAPPRPPAPHGSPSAASSPLLHPGQEKNSLVQLSFWLYWSPFPHHKMSLELEPALSLSTTDPKCLPFSAAGLFCAYHSSQAKMTLQMNSIMHSACSPGYTSTSKSFDCFCCRSG